MRTRYTTVDDLEDFWAVLQGPLGRALRDAWSIVTQRLQAQSRELSDLPDHEMVDLLCVAFREAAPFHYRWGQLRSNRYQKLLTRGLLQTTERPDVA